MMYPFIMAAFCIFTICANVSWADLVFDNFENDKAPANGPGTDAGWNRPAESDFQVAFENQKTAAGSGALRVIWSNKDQWTNFVIAGLDANQNAGKSFGDADALRMSIAGPAVPIIVKLADTGGTTTGDVHQLTTSGSDTFEIYEFSLASAFNSPVDLANVSEVLVLMDAGHLGTSGTVYIDSIELITGSGPGAQVVAVVDNFDNDNSIADDPNAPDSIPSGNSLLPGPFVTTVVNDPVGGNNSVLKVDYNTAPYSVLWVTELDVTDWSEVTALTLDVYGTANDILLKLKDASGAEQEPSGGWQDHSGDQWDTLTWEMPASPTVDVSNMGKLIVFIEGPTGGQGTVYFDNLTLVGNVTRVEGWELY